jgi:hypothetical protein
MGHNGNKNKMKIIYRISDAGYSKVKPEYVNNEACLKNALEVFPWSEYDWSIIADNISEETNNMIQKYIPRNYINYVSVGHGAGTFNLALDEALQYKDDEIVYFIENDYLHLHSSPRILEEGFDLGASFVSLYDHPDKYKDPSTGGNPYCEGGAEDTRVYLSESSHWKITNSTTMTFAAKVSTLKKVESTLRKHTDTKHPNDFQMFIELRQNNELLITPIPGYSTHGETAWLSPLINWNNIPGKSLNDIYKKWSYIDGHGDKGTAHTYIPEYERLLSPYRYKKPNFLEIGVAYGESLEMWYEYFQGVKIHGIDIWDKEIGPYLKDKRFNINIVDATKKEVLNCLEDTTFDIIIDDGSHRFEDQVATFNILKDKMNAGGIFIIEDVDCLDEKRDEFIKLHSNCEIIDNRSLLKRYDDVLIVYRF